MHRALGHPLGEAELPIPYTRFAFAPTAVHPSPSHITPKHVKSVTNVVVLRLSHAYLGKQHTLTGDYRIFIDQCEKSSRCHVLISNAELEPCSLQIDLLC